jgi:hypothetical protein
MDTSLQAIKNSSIYSILFTFFILLRYGQNIVGGKILNFPLLFDLLIKKENG